MTAAALLEIFRLISHDQLYAQPHPPAVAELVLQLPTENALYVATAEEAFAVFLLDCDEPNVEAFQRFVDILTILLYRDGRTFLACLRIAELANERPAYGVYGVNALAALANYMRRSRPIPIHRGELIATLREFEGNSDLAHNATECRKILEVAYP